MQSYQQALDYIHSHIPTHDELRTDPRRGLNRMKHILERLGRPQNSLRVIHIAGTSGKGSTAYILSALLASHGMRIGLYMSPHIYDIRERIQVNNVPISEEMFVHITNQVAPVIDEVAEGEYGRPSYFEILTAMMYVHFRDTKVEYAVVETGLGGLYDATNTVDRSDKLCVITPIGYDHVGILGDTLEKIAVQKAGIIRRHTALISNNEEQVVHHTLRDVTDHHDSTYIRVTPRAYTLRSVSIDRMVFDYNFGRMKYEGLRLSSPGIFQIQNTALALAALDYAARRDNWMLRAPHIRQCLDNIHVPGRMQSYTRAGQTVIVDGAHNPQKMHALVESMKALYPGRNISLLLSIKNSKDYDKMLACLESLPLSRAILTSFNSRLQDRAQVSEDPVQLRNHLTQSGILDVQIIPNIAESVREVIKDEEAIILVTGSMYIMDDVQKELLNNHFLLYNR